MAAKTHPAPWSRVLVATSILATLLCVGVTLVFGVLVSGSVGWPGWLLLAMPPVCALFVVRGYRVESARIVVLRAGWVTRLPRAGLESVRFEPGAMRRSLRVCGNGGFFSFTGLYWNKELKMHRAFVTDPQRTVVLRYAGRTVVVSPAQPEEFVRELAMSR
ncbi:MAG: PH domain-containing protein [Terrimicrobiaceae bacterium]|nr:PH domain-containing protein [Terrimicrobiaceae bacterium]